MGFADLIRSGVALANTLTGDLQASVTHHAWIAQTGFGEDTFADPVTRPALVDRTVTERYTQSGRLVQTLATLTFLEPIPANGAAGRTEPVDPRDRFVLDDGTTAPVVEVKAFEDAGTQTPFVNVITLGRILAQGNI